MTNKDYIIEIFTGLGFKKREDYTSFVQLDSRNKGSIFSIVINDKVFYVMLHNADTSDYLFSKHYKLDMTEEELQKIIRKIIGLYEHFKSLFWEQK